jgi:competence protein ComEA
MPDEGLTTWLRRSGWVVMAAACLLGMLAWRALRSSDTAQPSRPVASAAHVATPQAKAYFVYVTGEVRRPGVYEMGGDTRVIQALRRAGGPTKRADLTSINLAAPISDGQQIVVAPKITATSGGAPAIAAGGGAAGRGPVSLASATMEQLEALDGIGPALAARIIAFRTEHGGFQSVDQLLDVPGIGDGRLAALRSSLVP